MKNDRLEQKLTAFFDGEKATVTQMRIERGATMLDQIRDAMLDIGTILEEDLDRGIYVTRVTGGYRSAYGPIIAATPSDDGVDVGGIVVRGKKKPVLEAMAAFEDALNGNPPKPRRRHFGLKLFLLLTMVAISAIAFTCNYLFPRFIIPAQAATVEYNDAVEEFNSIVPRYNRAAAGVDVGNLRGFVQEAQGLSIQGTDYVSICKAIIGGNRAEKIRGDTDMIREMAKKLEDEIPVLDAIRNPSEEWVKLKLKEVDGIDLTQAVTLSNDPNGMLGKEGGYTSCTYFTTGYLGKDVVKGATPVQKGVDGGGAIEVYQTLEDARARCEYLSGFDGTVLYSGSYALVGTMVIRTSCLLDDDAQYVLTGDIVNVMIDG
jgi:hypothetical protein